MRIWRKEGEMGSGLEIGFMLEEVKEEWLWFPYPIYVICMLSLNFSGLIIVLLKVYKFLGDSLIPHSDSDSVVIYVTSVLLTSLLPLNPTYPILYLKASGKCRISVPKIAASTGELLAKVRL